METQHFFAPLKMTTEQLGSEQTALELLTLSWMMLTNGCCKKLAVFKPNGFSSIFDHF